jgi:hypothetical protein
MDDFHKLINEVLARESGLIKLTYGFVMIVENNASAASTGLDQPCGASYSVVSSKENKKYSTPITVNLVNQLDQNIPKLTQYLDSQIDLMINYRLDNMTSSSRFIAITNFAIYVSRMTAVGGK